MAEPLLNLHDTAVRLRCSIRHVRRLVHADRLEVARAADGTDLVVEKSLSAYEDARAAATERADAFTRKLNDLGAPPE